MTTAIIVAAVAIVLIVGITLFVKRRKAHG